MSSATIAAEPPNVRAGTDARPSLVRLTTVELRKMVDTRAGFWVQLAVLGLTITVVIIQTVTGHADDHVLRKVLSAAVGPSIVLLPIVGILLLTSEWTQRTTLITFALVPRRERVLAAKLAAGVLLATAAVAVSLALAALATAIAAPRVAGTWSLSAALLGQTLLLVIVAMIMGFAFGAMLLSSAPAIVLAFVLPLGWTALGSISALTGTARWLDRGRSLAPMTEHVMNGTEWARVGTTLALWIVVPLLIGVWRIRRNEVG